MINKYSLTTPQVVSLVAISATGSLVAAALLVFTMYIQDLRRKRAYKQDVDAVKKLTLPCYQPLYVILTAWFTLLSIGELISVSEHIFSDGDVYFILQLHSLCLLAAFLICPVLFIFRSVSTKTIRLTAAIIIPWYVLCLICLALYARQPPWYVAPQVTFLFISFLPSFILSVGILTRNIVTRITLASRSARNFVEHLIVFVILFAGLNLFSIIDTNSETIIFDFLITYVCIVFVWNILFVLAMHRALLADTKYWRGLGTHNAANLGVAKPTLAFTVASSYFQDFMGSIGPLALDFAFLEVKSKIGEGATSMVYVGQYTDRIVAIKLYTPNDITAEVLDEFVKEGKVLANFDHKNILKFVGLCIRPPHIAFVTELCEEGSLKASIQRDRFGVKWTSTRKLQACLEMCRALEYLHEKQFLHRDIKTENFFVAKDLVVKLGDFGTTLHRTALDNAVEDHGRMPIDGTPEYQAPELVACKSHYTNAIDIYALGISFWEVWTGENCYKHDTRFQIYQAVESGLRPPVNMCTEASIEFIHLMERAWHQDPNRRPSAKELVYLFQLQVGAVEVGRGFA